MHFLVTDHNETSSWYCICERTTTFRMNSSVFVSQHFTLRITLQPQFASLTGQPLVSVA